MTPTEKENARKLVAEMVRRGLMSHPPKPPTHENLAADYLAKLPDLYPKRLESHESWLPKGEMRHPEPPTHT